MDPYVGTERTTWQQFEQERVSSNGNEIAYT